VVFKGDTNIAYLKEHGYDMDEWANENGDLDLYMSSMA